MTQFEALPPTEHIPSEGQRALLLTGEFTANVSPERLAEIGQAISALLGGEARAQVIENLGSVDHVLGTGEAEPTPVPAMLQHFREFAVRTGEYSKRHAVKAWQAIESASDWDNGRRVRREDLFFPPLRFIGPGPYGAGVDIESHSLAIVDLQSVQERLAVGGWDTRAWGGYKDDPDRVAISFLRHVVNDMVHPEVPFDIDEPPRTRR